MENPFIARIQQHRDGIDQKELERQAENAAGDELARQLVDYLQENNVPAMPILAVEHKKTGFGNQYVPEKTEIAKGWIIRHDIYNDDGTTRHSYTGMSTDAKLMHIVRVVESRLEVDAGAGLYAGAGAMQVLNHPETIGYITRLVDDNSQRE